MSYHDNNETKICLGNISSGEEIELKTYYFGHIVCKDLSYQAKFPVKFPQFLLENIKKEKIWIIINIIKKKLEEQLK